ncbi:MAG: hypothetical protein Q9195_008175 [Heterodermia aff. obscurata]
MTSPHICIRCRHTLSSRYGQLRHSSFVSLLDLVNRDGKESPILAKPAAEVSQRVENGINRSRPRAHDSKKPTRRKHQESEPLEDLFSSNLHNAHAFVQKHLKSSSPSLWQTVDEDIISLEHQFSQRQAPLLEIWKICQQLFDSHPWKTWRRSRLYDNDLVFKSQQLTLFRDILFRIAQTRVRYPSQQSPLPLPTNVILPYIEYGIMQNWWDQILWKQLGTYITTTLYPTDPQLKGEMENPMESALVLGDILGVWCKIVSYYGEHGEGGSNHQSTETKTARFRNPYRWPQKPFTSSVLQPTDQPSDSDALERMTTAWPQYCEPDNHKTSLFLAAVMTLEILERRKGQVAGTDTFLKNAEPCFRFFQHLVQGCNVKNILATACLKREGIFPQVQADILLRWKSLGVDAGIGATLEIPASARVSDKPIGATDSQTIINSSLVKVNAQLYQAKAREDPAFLTTLWRQCQSLLTSPNVEPKVHDELFSNFLNLFFALGRQNQAVEVWNFIIGKGIAPTLKHWHAMLRGCAKARDLTSLQEIWSQMLSAGVKPDSSIWTSRIRGLMICGAWQAGIEALEFLGRQWKTQSSNEGLQPSLDHIHAALLGILPNRKLEDFERGHDFQKRSKYIDRINSFAKAHNIAYDLITYNILLRPAVRADDEKKVQSILQEMRTSGCEADIATFTIILNGLVSNPTSTFHTQPHPVQQATIFNFLTDMEAAGVAANPRTYSTILEGLLDPRSSNFAAAEAIIAHMAARNVALSPHIYTILITHFFDLQPPDLAAVGSLLLRAKAEKTPLDPVFYDRLIENYARVGETEKMLKVLRRMPESGMTPGWVALTAGLECLVEGGEWDLVRALVRDVEDRGGLFRNGAPLGWRGKDAFWGIVAEVRGRGVLDGA